MTSSSDVSQSEPARFSYQFYTSLNLMYVKVLGSLSYTALWDHPTVFMQDPEFKPGVNIIYDCLQVDSLSVEDDLLHKSVEKLCDKTAIPVPATTIFIASDKQQNLCNGLQKICDVLKETRVPHLLSNNIKQALDTLDLSCEDFLKIDANQYRHGTI